MLQSSEQLKAYRDEAKELRQSIVTEYTTDVVALHEQLVNARRALDRLEFIVADLGLVRHHARRLVTQAENDFEDAYRTAVNKTQVGEFMSAKAQDATYSGASIDEQIRLRKAKDLLAMVTETYDYVSFLYKGLDSARRDIDSRIRLLAYEARFDRQ